MKGKDITNQTFNKLTALYLMEKKDPGGGTWWMCRCACGNEKPIRRNMLTTYRTISCGCAKGNFNRWYNTPKIYINKDASLD